MHPSIDLCEHLCSANAHISPLAVSPKEGVILPEFTLFNSRAGIALLKAVYPHPRYIYCRTSINRWHLMCVFIFVNYDIVYNFENVLNFVTARARPKS
jgi:hypothetical protein